jgi:hypothetical protein
VALIEVKHYKVMYKEPDQTGALSTYIDAAGHSENVEITKWCIIIIITVVVIIICC